MADIAISALIQQIENQIQQNRATQALALCTHILYYYPKHLETYSLMAQALALQGSLDGALDVYRRVLSADPENPGAYAGIAHVFDHRHRLEEAVWHMERAFELAPAQPDIRKELLRLYAQYEVTPRERLKLTRGALARLYAQEGLYDQAIHEFREIGSTSLSRYDIRVALAETLWHAGRARDAAEVAQSLLDSLPYCLKANLILGTAWHESGIAESQKYLERAVSLDPSNLVAQKMLGPRSPLRTVSVRVPEYVEGAPPPPYAIEVKQPPAPERPIIVPVEEGETLSLFDEPESPQAPEPIVEKPQEPIAEKTETQTAKVTETPRDSGGVNTAPAAAPAPAPSMQELKPSVIDVDLPPWLRSEDPSLTESPRAETVTAESVSLGASPSPEWLAELRRTFSDELKEEKGVPAELIPVPVVVEKEPTVEPPPPAILEPTPFESVAEAPPVTAEATTEENLPTWLSGETETVEEKIQEDEAPAWLNGPAPARAERAETTEPRIPKWVEVLSRREPEPTRITEETFPARSEPSGQPEQSPAPAAQVEQTLSVTEHPESEIPSARSEPVTPAPPPVRSEPIAVYPEPEPSMPVELSAQATQVAEPEPPMVVAAPLAPSAETTAQPKLKGQPQYYSRLAQAREHRNADRVNDALREYEFVTSKAPRLINEVILDLEALVATGDAPLDAHRLLGDAYTRAGRLNDALERYRYVKRVAESNP